MLKTVEKTIELHKMIAEGERIIVALSGGADSVALLYALFLLREKLGFTLAACHVNHNLRGEESDSDERYARELCARLGLTCYCTNINVHASMQKHQSLEECARELRYSFFAQVAGTGKIATAHSASDNAETVLLNLTRGTALKGLCGIPPVRGSIIRPLIYCTRAEIEAFCAENGLAFVTDKTNLCDDYTRNKLRHNVIPRLAEINPAFFSAVERMTLSVGEDNELLERLTAELAERARVIGGYDCKVLAAAEHAILTRFIMARLRESAVTPSRLRVELTEEIIRRGSGKVNLERNRFAIAKRGVFNVEKIYQNYRKK